jgi:hypothetical protein
MEIGIVLLVHFIHGTQNANCYRPQKSIVKRNKKINLKEKSKHVKNNVLLLKYPFDNTTSHFKTD